MLQGRSRNCECTLLPWDENINLLIEAPMVWSDFSVKIHPSSYPSFHFVPVSGPPPLHQHQRSLALVVDLPQGSPPSLIRLKHDLEVPSNNLNLSWLLSTWRSSNFTSNSLIFMLHAPEFHTYWCRQWMQTCFISQLCETFTFTQVCFHSGQKLRH